jgi:RNA polymerase sigma-70 factor (ECF subfamily)
VSVPDCPWLEAPLTGTASGECAEPAAQPRVLEGWFKAHFEALWRLAARLGVPPEHVDDVVQDVFVTADRRSAAIAPGAERSFLIGTTVKISANYRRRARTRRAALAQVEHAPREAVPDAEQLVAQKQLRQLLDLALDALSHEQRAVFVLHELEELEVAEIARVLAIPTGTVASRLARAKEKFSKQAARLRPRWFGRGEP